ncbi:MAG: sn-glycerol-1-phosphate dehydrogenase [Verrucomicrobia bacterium]|nr:sn-glycerol-1-phosphate dehydrogenase [Verrucomicrobiota bacterium]
MTTGPAPQPPSPTPAKLTLTDALSSARETRALVVGRGVVREAARVFADQFPGATAVVVADPTTQRVAGESVIAALRAAGIASESPFLFTDPGLYAEFRFVAQLEASLRTHGAIPIAVGSGTINDLVKLAAHRTGRPGYLCVATAASMDGYTAFGASITFEGAKQTFNCPAPRAVVADLDIIGRAPPDMTASGYADLLAKVPAGADWILADALSVEPVEARAWAIVQGGLRDALADPAGARAGRPTAIAPLVEGLMLGGFAMQWSKSSRPASGAEHQFSHLWDMEHHTHQGAAPSHGFKVGVATHAVSRFYERLLARDLQSLDVDAAVARWSSAEVNGEAVLRARFAGTDFVATAVAETQAKQIAPAALREQLHRLQAGWPQTRARLQGQLLPAAEVKRRLELVGAPSEPEQIGISRARLRDTFVRAYHIRRRFTVLDVAVRAGLRDALLDELFGPGAPWDVRC